MVIADRVEAHAAQMLNNDFQVRQRFDDAGEFRDQEPIHRAADAHPQFRSFPPNSQGVFSLRPVEVAEPHRFRAFVSPAFQVVYGGWLSTSTRHTTASRRGNRCIHSMT